MRANIVKYAVGNVNDAAIKRGNLPIEDSMRSEKLPITVPIGDESTTANIMKVPIVSVDQSKIHRRDEHKKGDQKLPILPMDELNLRQPNERYERDNKLPIISAEDSKFHQRGEHYKGEHMRIEDSIPSRLSTLRESA